MLFENIVALCKEKKISIAKLEKECGLGNATIRKWKESAPTLNNLNAVANFFGVNVMDLMNKQKER